MGELTHTVCPVLCAGISLLTALCQRGAHLGTSDLTPMVRNNYKMIDYWINDHTLVNILFRK